MVSSFLYYVNDVFANFDEKICKSLYADDIKIACEVSSITDCMLLQYHLDKVCTWSQNWGMTLSIEKCKVMSITRKRNKVESAYNINNNELEHVDHFTDLGIIVTTDLNFNMHSTSCIKKARSR